VHPLFWPKAIKLEPRGVARLGRVLHWAITFAACLTVIGCAYHYLTTSNDWDRQSALAGMVAGIGLFMFGRAVRYVLSAE
jgi:hypothetical protein